MPTARSPVPSRGAADALLSAAKFLLPFAVSAIVAYGVAERQSGARDATVDARFTSVERDVSHEAGEREKLVTRDEFGLVRGDVQDIKSDVREVRDTQKQILLKLTK